ncbi:MAG: hypothetical protein A4E35_02451 [Methanoregula sp. PtaU1.Bin051]|nr:MAG: hypothetical protein A4E35_02451 [Methanoregula sp. PtaU1.Bin051]
MNERVRRILIFGTIVTAGSVLIFFDLPLLIIIPAIVAVGIVLLILLGAITLSDLKSVGTIFKKREKEKTPAGAGAKKPAAKTPPGQPPSPKKAGGFSFSSLFARKSAKPSPAAPKPAAGKKSGLSLHADSFISSLKSLGTLLATRKKADPDKLKKIDNMLDLAVSGKVEAHATPKMTSPGQAPSASSGGAAAGTAPSITPGEEDPFLSLSGEEFDAGLLDGLDDDETATKASLEEGGEPAGGALMDQAGEAGTPSGEPGETASLDDISAAADDILKASGEDLGGDLPSLEGLDSSSEGDLGDLDSISLDSVELDEDEDMEDTASAPQAPAPAAAEAPNVSLPKEAAPIPASSIDTGRSEQQEMAAFAAASGGDDDMLSSLAASIKTVKKEKDLSLLRDLKDFRAPGTEIETELTELHKTLNAATEKQKKRRTSAAGKKSPPK